MGDSLFVAQLSIGSITIVIVMAISTVQSRVVDSYNAIMRVCR
jgi:hypothetical protein